MVRLKPDPTSVEGVMIRRNVGGSALGRCRVARNPSSSLLTSELSNYQLAGAEMVFDVNGKRYDVDVSQDMPLLWVLRDAIGLTGTKFGCGLGQCGACTVHLDGTSTRACLTE